LILQNSNVGNICFSGSAMLKKLKSLNLHLIYIEINLQI
jgi:hypothetical protein